MTVSSEQQQTEFEKLVRDLGSGSNEAAAKIVELYSGNILRAVRRSLPRVIRSKLDSVDIFQSVWVSVLAKRTRLAQLDTPQRFVAYLAATARLKALEKYRHFTRVQACDVRRERRVGNFAGEQQENFIGTNASVPMANSRHPTASSVAEAREAWGKLMSTCDKRDHEVIKLRLAGKTYEEIAEQLDVSTRTVRRTLQKLLHTIES